MKNSTLKHTVISMLLFVGLILGGATVTAADSLIVAKIDLNGDCVTDTVYGVGSSALINRLAFIRWGVRNDTNQCDSLWNADTSRTYYAETVIRYPALDSVRTSVQWYHFNMDQARDLLVSVSCKESIPYAGPDSTTLLHDTSFVVVLLAQRGIDTVDTLDIDLDSGLVTTPITMRYLQEGNGIVRVSKSFGASCVIQTIPKMNIAADLEDTTAMPRARLSTSAKKLPKQISNALQINVFPNPTDGTKVNVECAGLQGKARLQILSLHGEAVQERSFNGDSSPRPTILLDVTSLASGLYLITVSDEAGQLGRTTIHIVR